MNDWAALFRSGRPRVTVQVEVTARSGERGASTSVDCLEASVARPRPADWPGPRVLDPAVSLVCLNLAGSCNRPARAAGAVAQGRLSPLLALEVAPSGGRPQIEAELRVLIRQMSLENPL